MSQKKYENAVIKFINKSQIDFVLVKQKTTIPFSIRKIIKDSLVDSKTGDRILFVKS